MPLIQNLLSNRVCPVETMPRCERSATIKRVNETRKVLSFLADSQILATFHRGLKRLAQVEAELRLQN